MWASLRLCTIRQMKKNKTLRFAPGQDGVPRADIWRLWVQGDECYLATRNTANLGKISLHHNFNWQYRVGDTTQRLHLRFACAMAGSSPCSSRSSSTTTCCGRAILRTSIL